MDHPVPLTGSEEEIIQVVKGTYPQTEFVLDTNSYGDNYLTWTDGPSTDTLRQHAPALAKLLNGCHDQPTGLILCRDLSLTAWAIMRGNQIPTSSTQTPLSPTELLEEYDKRDRDNPIVLTTRRTLDDTNIYDLADLAGDPLLHRRAEVAGRLGEDLGGVSLALYDTWLTHGGWAMACTLAQ